MSKVIFLLIGLFCFSNFIFSNTKPDSTLIKMVDNIKWLGQAGVKLISENKVIYIDPFQINETDKGDIILITHSHSDHLSIKDIRKIITPKTILVAPKTCEKDLTEFDNKTFLLEPGDNIDLEKIHVEAVPAYNVKKTQFHPKENKWLGYVLTINNITIYHAGDTERIPEMKNIDCDIAMLPLGQTYTMNSVHDAVKSALDVKAKIAIPIHFGIYEGTKEDALKFQRSLGKKIKVIIKDY